MAQVFEAVRVGERAFERRVALKRILPQAVDDPAAREMFLEEARVVSGLHHANIVQVFDYGTIDDSEFLVLELVDGMDAERLARSSGGRVPTPVALHVVQQIAHALAHAHEAEVVHRDVTPQNILLSWSGDVKLSDFGIALARGRQVETTVGVVKGKVAYLAPEQREGLAATGRADVYALGQTLHRLLRGETASPEAIGARDWLDDEAPDVRELLRAMLSPSPAERPDAAEVAAKAAALLLDRAVADGRRRLIDLLDSLRPASDVSRALDEVVALVIAPTTDGGREFTAERPAEPTTVAEGPKPATDRRRALWAATLLLGALLLGAMGLGTLGLGASGAPEDSPATTSAATPPREIARDAAVEEAPVPEPVARVVDTPATEPPTEAAAPPAPPPRTPARPRPAPEAPPTARGTLLVAGRALHGGDVFIDGRRHPQTVPTSPVSLPAGAHRVEVRDPATGETWLAREVEVIGQREIRVTR